MPPVRRDFFRPRPLPALPSRPKTGMRSHLAWDPPPFRPARLSGGYRIYRSGGRASFGLLATIPSGHLV